MNDVQGGWRVYEVDSHVGHQLKTVFGGGPGARAPFVSLNSRLEIHNEERKK